MIFHIAIKDIRVVFRDKKALAIILLMPSLLILILGTALGSMFSTNPTLEKFAVGVVDYDNQVMSRKFIDDFLMQEVDGLIDTREIGEKDVEEMIKNKTLSAVIVIPEGFTANIAGGKPVEMEIRSRLDNQLHSSIVKSIAESYAQGVSLTYTAGTAILDTLQGNPDNIDLESFDYTQFESMMEELGNRINSNLLSFESETRENRKTVSALQFYAASMLVMFLLFGANLGTKLLVEERETKTLGRIMSARASRGTLIIGKLLGLMFICILQAAILITFTNIAYGVNWGGSIPGIALVTFCAIFAAAGFGMLIAAIAKTTKAADSMGEVFIQIFTLLGGGMIPSYVFPDSLKMVARITPNWWALKGYNEMMMGVDISTILPYCAVLMIMGIIYLSAGILRFRIE